MYWVSAFVVGFYVGTASYKTKCFEKIMQLENSNLAEQVREYLVSSFANAIIKKRSDWRFCSAERGTSAPPSECSRVLAAAAAAVGI